MIRLILLEKIVDLKLKVVKAETNACSIGNRRWGIT